MSRRIERVNALLREEISRVLATELRDPRISSIVSVTRVDAAADLHSARVFVSVLGDESEKKQTLEALSSAAGFIHRSMRRSLALRATPSLEFVLDDSIERGAELLQLIERVSPPTRETDEPR